MPVLMMAQKREMVLKQHGNSVAKGPDIYDTVLIEMPYPDDLVGKTIKVSIPVLYDNEFNEIWNASVNTTADILVDPRLSDYEDYLNTPYEAYLNGTGVICNESDPTLSSGLGYKNTTNQTIWIKIPHFSGVGPLVAGIPPSIPANFTATKSGTSTINLDWELGNGADYTQIRRNTGSSPTSISEGINVSNSTGTSKSDTGLSADTTYFYSAWSWNVTEGLWSTSYATDSAKTDSTGGGSSPPPQEEEEETDDVGGGTASSEDTMSDIEDYFNINLDAPFYVNDTNGDGVADIFTDPNGILTNINDVTINGNTSFLLSIDGDEIPEFFWDVVADTITPVTHNIGSVIETTKDVENDTITITVSVNKSDWIYIEVADAYPSVSDLIVKASDGRVISTDMIWREDGKIYVLDDPDTEYTFTYNYTIFPPTFNPVSGTTFTTAKPTITITYNETVTITSVTLNDGDVTLASTDDMRFTYHPISNLTNGAYTLSITVQDDESNTRTDETTFTIAVEETSEPLPTSKDAFPLTTAILIVVAASIIMLVVILLLIRLGYLFAKKEK